MTNLDIHTLLLLLLLMQILLSILPAPLLWGVTVLIAYGIAGNGARIRNEN